MALIWMQREWETGTGGPDQGGRDGMNGFRSPDELDPDRPTLSVRRDGGIEGARGGPVQDGCRWDTDTRGG